MTTNSLPNAGKMLKDFIEEYGIVRAALARELKLHPKSLKWYLEHEDIQLHALIKISNILEHNFIRQIADTLPDTFKPTPTPNRENEVAALQLKISQQETEIKALRDALLLVGGTNNKG